MAPGEAHDAAGLAEVALRDLRSPFVEARARLRRQQAESLGLHDAAERAALLTDAAVAHAAAARVDLHLETVGAAVTAAGVFSRSLRFVCHERGPSLAFYGCAVERAGVTS